MKAVYRLKEWELQQRNGEVALVVTCTTNPIFTNIDKLLEVSFPGLVIMPGKSNRGNWLLDVDFMNRNEFALSGRMPKLDDLDRFMILLSNVLTVCDQADVSHCLDVYRVPDDEVPSEDWEYTPIGLQAFKAKYRWDVRAAKQLGAAIFGIDNEPCTPCPG